MGREYRAKVFRSGNSVAVILPEALGFEQGQEIVLREEAGKLQLEAIPVVARKIDVDAFWGSIPDLKPLTADERLFDERPLDWESRALPGDD